MARSSFYAAGTLDPPDDTALVERMHVIQDERPAYGNRRITAHLRAGRLLVNRKRVARLLRLHGMQVRPRRRYVATTDSDHDGPIFRNLAKHLTPDGPDQLWVADLTYSAVATGFVYLAVILDAWSRRVVGHGLGRMIDARLTLAALEVAIATRQPAKGCVHHSDRGSQYAAERYRRKLAEHGLTGSMGRRGKWTTRRSATSPTICPASSMRSITRDGCIRRWVTKAYCSSRSNTPVRRSKQQRDLVPPEGVTPDRGSSSNAD
jgi:putative transposase